jgi:hypothetical protein
VEYIVAPDEGHGFAGRENRLAMFAAVERFLARHLGGRHQEGMSGDVAARLASLTVDPADVTLPAEPATGVDPMLASLPAPDPAALRPLEMTFSIVLTPTGGQDIQVENRQRLARVTVDSGEYWQVESSVSSPRGDARDTYLLHAHSLLPARRTVEQGAVHVEMEYSAGGVRGEIQAGPQKIPVDVTLDAPVLGDGASTDTYIAALPLAEGYRGTLRILELNSQKVRPWSLEVTGTETIEVPAGRFECFRVELTPLDDQGGESTLWFRADRPHALVMVESAPPPSKGMARVSTVLTELTAE